MPRTYVEVPGVYRFIRIRYAVYQCERCGKLVTVRYWLTHERKCSGIDDCHVCAGMYPCEDPKCSQRQRAPYGTLAPPGPTPKQLDYWQTFLAPRPA